VAWVSAEGTVGLSARTEAPDDYRQVRPRVPARPLLTCAAGSKGATSVSQVAAVTDLPHVAWLSNGRSAIARAAQLAGVDASSSVLVPAYHCESMAAPFAWLGARIGYYRIREDLAIDLDHLIASADERTNLVLVPQYFGHLRPTSELHELCRQRGWTLVEDCAHAFFALGSPDHLGRDSDYVVASSSKFFAAFDGGVLASRSRTVPRASSRPGLTAEIRTAINAMEYAFEYGRLPRLRRLASPLLERARRLRSSPTSTPSTGKLASRYGGVEFEAESVDVRATRVAQWLAVHADRSAIAWARRDNWQAMRERLSRSAKISFPIPELDDRAVPYVLAVEIPEPERVFPELKRRGVPVYRWETAFEASAIRACPVSARFRRTLIQLPCHQGLTPVERDWIADTVLSVV
jgi:dTDP-4-amino-4,6-dideoxygalactose transaminase